jgi:hypothetical protein
LAGGRFPPENRRSGQRHPKRKACFVGDEATVNEPAMSLGDLGGDVEAQP